MANQINATTLQLKFIAEVFAAWRTLDMSNVEPLLSKNYVQKSFPRSADLPDLTKADLVAKHELFFSSFTKIEVRIKHRETTFRLEADIHHP